MYSKRRLAYAASCIRRIAVEDNVPEEQVRRSIEKAMKRAQNSPDPSAQERWATFHYAGPEPTVEEFILWSADMAWAEFQKASDKDQKAYRILQP